jgi:hypothetical protein
MDITVTVTGMDELIKKVNDPDLIGQPMHDFFEKSTISIQNEVRTLTPVDTGRLWASIIATVDPSPVPMWGQVTTPVQPHYGKDVEYGTVAHYPPIAALIDWAHRHHVNPYALQKKIGLYGTKGRFMFQTGVQNSLSQIEAFLKEAARAIETRWGSK